MGWDMWTSSKPYIWNYNPSTKVYEHSTPYYYTWASATIWESEEACLKFVNDTGAPMKISSVAIKTVACDSGGDSYWSSTGVVYTPCVGYGAKYTCYVRVTNDSGSTFEESDKYTNDVANLSGSNMNSRGTSTSNTASFGNPPFTGDKLLQLRNYEFLQCPTISAGGTAYVHIRIHDFKGPTSQTTIRFILNPLEMEVHIEPEIAPYIWKFKSDGQWHLTRPIKISTGGGNWINIDGGTDE